MIRIRDEAWTLITDDTDDAHIRLWQDLDPAAGARFVPPAASLLGMAAWRQGDAALAGIAADAGCEIDPDYSMANLLMHALRHLLPPHVLKERMPSPEELDQEMGSPTMAWLLPHDRLVGGIDDHGGVTAQLPARFWRSL